MKKHFLPLVIFSACLLLNYSCILNFPVGISGNGNVKTESRDVSDFTSVEAATGLNVFIAIGDSYSLEVEADENLHDIIRTKVSSGTLSIYSEKAIRNAKAKNIRLTVPELEEIEVSSAADVRCENVIETDQLTLSVSSAGQLRASVLTGELHMDASSSGSMEIRGEAKELKANVSSAGSIDSDKLQSKYCRVSASSAGSISIWVTDELDAEASSAGSIQYKGDPENRKIETSSAGSVSKR